MISGLQRLRERFEAILLDLDGTLLDGRSELTPRTASAIAALVMLFDMPIATRFEATAIERSTPLRRRRLELDRIDRFSRMRRAVRRPGAGASSTGLVAMRGRRQILLVDRMEGHAEYEALRAVLGHDQADRLLSSVMPPPLNRTPTWTLRRRRWRPDPDERR